MGGIAGVVAAAGASPRDARLRKLRLALAHRNPGGSRVDAVGGVAVIGPAGPDAALLTGDPPSLRNEVAFAALGDSGRSLLLGSGGLGLRRLFWARVDDELAFASEPEALLEAGVPAEIRADSLRKILSTGFDARERTALAGVRRVLPGSLLRVDLATLECEASTAYEPGDEVDPGLRRELAGRSRRELAEMLEERLRATVHAQMGDGPVALFCSGGLDSALLTALACEAGRDGNVAFVGSVRLPGVIDEAPAARQVARKLGVELEEVRITAASLRSNLVGAVHRHGPMEVAIGVGVAHVAAAAARRGLHTAIAGDIADAQYGGDWGRNGDAIRACLSTAELRRRRLRTFASLRPRDFRSSVLRRRSRATLMPRPWVDVAGEWSWEAERAMRARAAYGDGDAGCRLAGEMLGDLYLVPALPRVDANAMQHGVEVRLPFIEPDVLRLTLNLPMQARVSGAPKGILSEVADRRLPRSIARRRKVGGMLTADNAWLTEHARPEFLRDSIARELAEIDAQTWARLLASAPVSQAFTLWTAEIWARLTAGGRTVDEVDAELWAAASCKR